jgi:uncharacterized coiled-coil protein SlyX
LHRSEEVGFAFAEQHVAAEPTITSLNHMTEKQLKAIQKISALLKKYVEELKGAREESQ